MSVDKLTISASDLGRRRTTGKIKQIAEPYLYLSPSIILICLVIFTPLVIGISYAFQSMHLFNPGDVEWIGFEHFEKIYSDRKFFIALKNTFWWTFGSVLLQFSLGLGLALLLKQGFHGRKVFQALIFLPWAVPTFLSALIWAWLFNPVIGPLPHWFVSLGMLDEPYNILADPDFALFGPIIANVWFGISFFAITLLASLQSIPDEMYEAAAIDGASKWQIFSKITLPFLAPMIVITVMLRTVWIANFADLIYVMTGGGAANSTQILSTYIFTTAFKKLDFGYASAVSVVLLVLLLLFATLLLKMRQKFVRVN
ncbi:MAG: sugar ABC transporter permease [Rhizobiales bacterium]|nr:sugar ABC transporter permease [Hyphomicrobiales bacterium]